MSPELDPDLLPWFAPLPGPMIAHLCVRLLRSRRAKETTSLQRLFALVQKYRATIYFYMDPYVQVRLHGGPATVGFSTGWLLKTLGAQAPGANKEPISARTLWYWRSKGLLRYQRYGLPDFSSAAALLLARLIDHVAERNFLPTSMTPEEQDWWCFTQAAPGAPVVPWRAAHLEELPATTLCWTPWLGAAWEPGWIMRRDQTLALRWAKLVKATPLAYRLSPQDLLRWDAGCASLELHDPDVLQAAGLLLLHRRALPRLSSLDERAFETFLQFHEPDRSQGADYDETGR